MWLRRKNSRRGITLIELVVVAVIAAVTAGLILDLFIQMRRQSRAGMTRVTMEDQARQLMDELRAIFAHAVPPQYLDRALPFQPSFEGGACALVSSYRAGEGQLNGWFISNASPNGEPMRVETLRGALGDLDNKRLISLIPSHDNLFASVDFRYATRVENAKADGGAASFVSELEPGQYPRVIQVRVRVREIDSQYGRPKSLELVSAIPLL